MLCTVATMLTPLKSEVRNYISPRIKEVLNIKTFLPFPKGGESLGTRLVRLPSSMLEGVGVILLIVALFPGSLKHKMYTCTTSKSRSGVEEPGNEDNSIVCVGWGRYVAVVGPGNEATTTWQQKELEAHSE